jgi:hypothetical protein
MIQGLETRGCSVYILIPTIILKISIFFDQKLEIANQGVKVSKINHKLYTISSIFRFLS